MVSGKHVFNSFGKWRQETIWQVLDCHVSVRLTLQTHHELTVLDIKQEYSSIKIVSALVAVIAHAVNVSVN